MADQRLVYDKSTYIFEYLHFKCDRLSPFKCSLSRLIHTNEWTAELRRIVYFIALFQAGQLDRAIARKKFISEAMFMKKV